MGQYHGLLETKTDGGISNDQPIQPYNRLTFLSSYYTDTTGLCVTPNSIEYLEEVYGFRRRVKNNLPGRLWRCSEEVCALGDILKVVSVGRNIVMIDVKISLFPNRVCPDIPENSMETINRAVMGREETEFAMFRSERDEP